MRGRKPKPVEAHVDEGTRSDAGAQRVPGTRRRVPPAGPGRPELPTKVAGRGRIPARRGGGPLVAAAHRELAVLLDRVLDLADAPMLEAAAVTLVRARAAGRDVERRGMLVEGRFSMSDGSATLVENPSVKQERDAWAAFRMLAEQLGIGPVARTRLAALGVEGGQTDPAENPDDELAEMRARRGA